MSRSAGYCMTPFDPEDPQQLADSTGLIRMLWGENDFSETAYANWQYRQNPFGPVFGHLVYAEDELAAQYVSLPTQLWDTAQQAAVRALLTVNLVTHPDHQRKGLFATGALKTFEAAAQDGFRGVYALSPNQRSLPGFLKTGFVTGREMYLHLKVRSHIQLASKALTLLRHRTFPPFEPLDPTILSHAAPPEVWAPANAEHTRYTHVPRSSAWLHWRYVQHPTRQYCFIGNADALFVIRPMTLYGLRVALVMDAIGAPTQTHIDDVKAFLRQHGFHLLVGVFSPDAYRIFPLLKKLFTLRLPRRLSPKSFHVVYKDVSGTGLPKAPFFFTLGDIDLY